MRDGVINGERKTIHKGKVIATAVGGRREDMEWINMNPQFEVYSVYYVNNPKIIAMNDNMVAINQALCIDLSGQVTAESLGTRIHSGSGGQPFMAMGALLSQGGRSITVIPSTARGGAVSRIVGTMEQGTIVTLPPYSVDNVVTEYGIARLRGKSRRQRAQELIAIAHPDFRAELKKEADRLFWP